MGCEQAKEKRIDAVDVSIHAPVWGANAQSSSNVVNVESFNPRTRVGCEKFDQRKPFTLMVSIHAPVWGANRHARHRPDVKWFQSTHPCGVRNRVVNKQLILMCFNPRTRVGCEAPVRQSYRHYHSFNPRTRVGCEGYADATKTSEVFQSTHPCGVRNFC